MKKYQTGWLLLLLLSVSLCLYLPLRANAESERQVVRIGYYPFADYMNQNQNGDYIGFNFEFLQELNKYTGWKHEIVNCVSWENAYAMLEAGEIDILPSVFYAEERAEQVDFPDLPLCDIAVTLNVRSNETRYDYEDYESFDGMKVGMIHNSKDADKFIEYSKKHQFTPEISYYSETDELLADLENKTLDGVAISHLGRNNAYRCVAQFSPDSVYIAVAKNSPEKLEQLNNALNTLKLRNPDFNAKLYEKYFSVSSAQTPVFTEEERKFIKETTIINAIYDETRAPLEFTDPQTGEFSGVVAELFREIAYTTGLQFHFIPVSSYAEAVELSKDPDINVICGLTSDYIWNSRNHFNTTKYYLRSPVVLINSNSVNETRIVAMPKNSFLADKAAQDNPDKLMLYCDTVEDCFEALRNGQADTTYVNSIIADFMLSDTRYAAFTLTTLTNDAEELCIGVSQSADTRLFSILDKCIQYTATEQMDKIILNNSIIQRKITWKDVLLQHPIESISAVIVFFGIVIVLLSVFLLMKSRNSRKIEKLLYRDNLTDLWNLHKFCIEAQECLKEDPQHSYALIYMDMKQFRTINDTLGFAEGDRVLRAFADVLQQETAKDECCARVSADMFVMLLHYDTWEKLTDRTKRIDGQINEWVRERGQHYHLILVFGVYITAETEKQDISLMLDFASYAKRSADITHKSITVLYDTAMRNKEVRQRDLADRMETALKDGEFVPYFQPKVDMPSGNIVGSEALVRWQYPGQGLISPGEFIPFFEKNGFVVEIDWYVFEEVCKSLQKWIALGWQIQPVSCNFSRLHLKYPDFTEKLQQIADRYKIPHHYLELEVTESIFEGDTNHILRKFEYLRECGFLISIDDFGSGYSSLGLLQQFSVDVLKLDRSFIQEGMRGEREKAVVRGVIEMAKQLNMQIICEGVEEKNQAESLMEMGCFTAQGFYYARPMPKEEFEILLQKKRIINEEL